MLINHPFLKVPRQNIIRFILIGWCFGCLNLSSIYSSQIVSFLTESMYEKKITTFDDLLNSGLMFGLTKDSAQFFDRELSDQDTVRIFNNSIMCRSILSCLNRTAMMRDTATAVSRNYFDYTKSKFKDQGGNFLIRSLDINIVYTPVEFLFHKKFPIEHRINGLMQRIVESGLIDFWRRNVNQNSIADETKLKLIVVNHRISLKFTILQDIFLFLFFGWFLATVFLIGEILVFWMKRKFFVNKNRGMVRKKKLRKRKMFVGRNVYKRKTRWIAYPIK